MKRILAFVLALACMLAAPSSAAGPEQVMKPDFTAVTSPTAARALAKQGKLVRIRLFPHEFGGEDRPENLVYVTPEAADAKDLTTETLVRFFREGLIDHLTVRPEYKGDSLVPSRIVKNASHSKKKGAFEPTVEVW